VSGEIGPKSGNRYRKATVLAVLRGVLLAGFLGACSAQPVSAPFEVPAFAGDPGGTELPGPERFLAIDDRMRAFVHDHLQGIRDPVQRLERLSALMLNDDRFGVRYDSELTLPAREVFRKRRANCLSFSALLLVLAREAGLDARFQDVPVLPNWRLAGDAFLVERHVNLLVRAQGRDFVIDFQPPATASWNRAGTISDANAIAQYFGNLGVERLTDGDIGTAYRLFRRGLETDPLAAALWINIGVALARNGQARDAEKSYRRALALDRHKLNNLAGLAELAGDRDAARALRSRLERYRRGNPQYLYAQGEFYLRAGEYSRALETFRRAVRSTPQEAEFHFALARSYRALGREEQAGRSFDAALKRAASESIRQRYRALFAAPPG
jgi:Flp pilus assembly protein TadD